MLRIHFSFVISAVFWNLEQFLHADMTKKDDFLTKHFFRNSRTELTPKHLMLFWFQENVRIRNLFEKRKMMCVEPADFQAWLIDWVSGFAEFDSMVYKKWIEDDIQISFLQFAIGQAVHNTARLKTLDFHLSKVSFKFSI